jgi:hypothetical protein
MHASGMCTFGLLVPESRDLEYAIGMMESGYVAPVLSGLLTASRHPTIHSFIQSSPFRSGTGPGVVVSWPPAAAFREHPVNLRPNAPTGAVIRAPTRLYNGA